MATMPRIPDNQSGSEIKIDILAEGEESQTSHLEMLPAPWYADDDDAEQQSANHVAEACPETAEDAP
jgi:hypothetical protein